MGETIFHLNANGGLTELNEAQYISEDLLQRLLAEFPNLLAGSQIDSHRPRRWMLVDREVGVPDEEAAGSRWSLDHLFIDQDGIPTLVEVKRSTDTRIRREVIGQILDYASNAVTYWAVEEIRVKFETQCRSVGKDPEETILELLQGEAEAESFWELVKTNLKAGKIRMLIVADTIPKELQRIIEFLNGQLSPAEILGVEIKQFTSQDNQKTLVPRVIGKTANADGVKGKASSTGVQWDEERFFASLTKQHGEMVAETARKILDWMMPYTEHLWFGAGKVGSLFPVPNLAGGRYSPLFALWTDGTVELQFQRMGAPFDSERARLDLLKKVNLIEGVDIPEGRISGRPHFPIKLLSEVDNLQRFFNAAHWFLMKSGALSR